MRLPPWIEGTFLRSRLGRRIFLTFCVAVIIPAVAVFWFTYRTASTNAMASSQKVMRTETKHFALTVFERLESAHAMLQRVDTNSATGPVRQSLLAPFFSSIEQLSLPLGKGGDAAAIDAALARHPGASALSATLVVLPALAKEQLPRIVLLSHRERPEGGRLIAGVIRPEYLWGASEDQEFNGKVCVHAGNQTLSCAGDAPLIEQGASALHDDWELFLEPVFGAESWRFVTVREREPLLASHLTFLAPLAFGLLLLVLMLSSIVIRRILVPLEALVARIRAVGQAGAPTVDTRMDDEFDTLTHTFGDMEGRIRRQLDTLRTLSEIDRLILERLPAAAVVDVVIARIHQIADVAGVGMTLRGVDPHAPKQHFLSMCGRRQTEMDSGSALEPMHESAYDLEPGSWSTTQLAGTGFARHDLQRVLVLALGHRDQSRAWVALACNDGPAPDEETLVEVRELAERVAVALAVEEHENLLVFQARHDPLTGLANRLAALEALAKAIERSSANGEGFAAVFIDLDRFKSINDGLGHAQGDLILVHAGERIRRSIGPEHFLARFGGDEFFVILHDMRSPADAARATAALAAAFEAPIMANGTELVIGFSAGLAMYPQHGVHAHELIHNSDVAMYRAKKSGGGRMEFFEEEMNESALTRVQLENDLRLAIRAGTLEVHYQPRVDSRSACIVGAEALARWTHPTKGRIAPDAFITLAEECGLIEELGAFVLDQACRQLAIWKGMGLDLPLIAVNVSSYQLRSGQLANMVARAVAASGIDWGELEIEVTESLLVNDSGIATQQLQILREAGATVAIDDFGTGYSSLAYLTRLPTDTLKIDRAFIASLDEDEASMAVIRSIIALAKALNKNIVAEGVESMAHVEMLGGWGCHVIQGYVYYRPLPADSMTRELVRLHAEGLAGVA